MCNCIGEIETKLREYCKTDEDFKDKKVIDLHIENTALIFYSKQPIQLYSPLKIEYETQNKKGETKIKKAERSVSYRYCPFCGEKYEDGEK